VDKAHRDILKHSAIYGVGQILTRLASFVMLPLYTHWLTPADYGTIAILDLTAGLLALLVGSGMLQAMSRYHFEAADDRDRDQVWWTGLSSLGLTSAAMVLPFWLMRTHLARWTLGPEQTDGSYFISLILATLVFQVIAQPLDQHLRVYKRSAFSVAVALGRLALNIALNVYFLVVLQLGVAGVLWGNMLAGAASTAVLFLAFAWSRGRYRLSVPMLGQLLRYGMPLIITGLLGTMMHQADRYLLRMFTDLGEVGIYSLAYTLAQAVNALILGPFCAIWNVAIFEIADRPDAKHVYRTVFRYYTEFVALALLGVSLFAGPILDIMASESFAPAAQLVPPLCLAYLLFGMHIHFQTPVLLAKRTTLLIPCYVVAVVANIGLNLLLIPHFGAMAAAWTSVVTFAVYSFTGLAVYRQVDDYQFPLARTGLVVAGMTLCYVLSHTLDKAGLNYWLYLALGTLMLCAWGWALFRRILPSLRQFVPRPSADVVG